MPPVVSVRAGQAAYSSPEPPLASPPSLLHGMLWLTCCAVSLGLANAEWRAAYHELELQHVALPTPTGRDYLNITLQACFTGICYTGALLLIARKLGWIRGQVEVGAWLLFSLGLSQWAGSLIGQLPTTVAFSRPAMRLASHGLAWSLPLLSHRMRRDGKWLCALILVVEIIGHLPVMYLLSLGQPVLGNGPRPFVDVIRWLVKWPCTVLGVATFIARDPYTRARGWLHVTGLVCVLIEDFFRL